MGNIIVLRTKKKDDLLRQQSSVQRSSGSMDTRAIIFKYSDLQEATKNFGAKGLLGTGAFGNVYKGVVTDETGQQLPVAVKRSKPGAFQGSAEWIMEVRTLERFQHPNVVRLIGYCGERDELLLVYELMTKGSLLDALFCKRGSMNLSWLQRMTIALDSARGLQYLHENNTIHRDFKAANLLLDDNLRTKITDFGLAKQGPSEGQMEVATLIKGTSGYMCPYYMGTSQVSLATDIYAFGVVLFELITGRKNVSDDGKFLTLWVQERLRKARQAPRPISEGSESPKPGASPTAKQRKYASMVDKRILQGYMENDKIRRSIETAIFLGDNCIHGEPMARPTATHLVDRLEDIVRLASGS
eukprot:TRINITY_DN2272_c0_g1_i1.p1 TRINITY_DN2272_c0_g1~~TRINITY_DN2272_c0_g1_i1.p1  ORF type:complete len:357 (-),score=53.15 TRINITY_DN2272_c0_g1_i1:820-1890(-)